MDTRELPVWISAWQIHIKPDFYKHADKIEECNISLHYLFIDYQAAYETITERNCMLL